MHKLDKQVWRKFRMKAVTKKRTIDESTYWIQMKWFEEEVAKPLEETEKKYSIGDLLAAFQLGQTYEQKEEAKNEYRK